LFQKKVDVSISQFTKVDMIPDNYWLKNVFIKVFSILNLTPPKESFGPNTLSESREGTEKFLSFFSSLPLGEGLGVRVECKITE